MNNPKNDIRGGDLGYLSTHYLDMGQILLAMTDAAAGDLMIVRNVLGFQEDGKEVVYMDHPTEAGGVVFVR
jgi:hypothetical protein